MMLQQRQLQQHQEGMAGKRPSSKLDPAAPVAVMDPADEHHQYLDESIAVGESASAAYSHHDSTAKDPVSLKQPNAHHQQATINPLTVSPYNFHTNEQPPAPAQSAQRKKNSVSSASTLYSPSAYPSSSNATVKSTPPPAAAPVDTPQQSAPPVPTPQRIEPGPGSDASSLSDEESAYSEEEEDIEDYVKGGYHPVSIGDRYNDNRYTILRKLGWGHFSTVWLAMDHTLSRPVALKIVKSAQHYTETAMDEIKLLDKVVNANPTSDQRQYVVELLDWFKHKGPHGTHVAMGFEVLGPNLLTLIRQYHHRGIPVNIVKRITKQVLMGLDYLHRECGIIHTDLKPENVLICVNVPETLRKLGITTESESEKSRSQAKNLEAEGKKTATTTNQGGESSGSKLTKSQKKKLRQKAKKKAAKEAAKLSGNDAATANGSQESVDATLSRDIDNLSLNDSSAPSSGPSASGVAKPLDIAKLENPERDAPQKEILRQKAPPKTSGPAVPSPSNEVPETEEERKLRRKQERRDRQRQHDEQIRVKIADLGNACWVNHHFTNDIQTRQYRSPEAILGANYDTSADMWSLGCMTFELLTGDYLFDPQGGQKYTKDDDHVAQIIELLGHFPKHVALSGKFSSEVFNRRGELRHIQKLRFWRLADVLQEKYHVAKEEAEEIADFILPMIEIDPERR
ncbi:kinase-like domain-containing protein [Zopfochytrium polystomum]|nr:kinase-like domain-containing protein [Zopfochytrium polystomum]